MTELLSRIFVRAFAACCSVLLACALAIADDPSPGTTEEPATESPAAEESPPADPATPSAEQVRETIESVFSHIWTPRSRFTDGPYTRGAFRPIVAEARRATAQIRCGGKRVAYGGIVGPDGWVLTKASQLRGAVVVRLLGGDAYPARVVGVDRIHDLAMLKIDATDLATLDLTPAPFANAMHLVRADREGGADEEDSKTLAGESAATPSSQHIDPALALFPGDWVATVGYGRDPAAIGVVSVLPRKIERRRGILGIRMKPEEESPDGVCIDRVYDDTGASRAGIEAGDVVLAVNGQPVATNAEVSEAIRVYYPGDGVVVTIKRGDRTLTLRAVLTGEVRDFGRSRSQYQNSLGGELSVRRFGFPAALQHDTVLRPEDCGGPLVDLDGRVVGFNIARAGRTESYALPTEAVKDRLYELMSGRLAPAESPDADTESSDEG